MIDRIKYPAGLFLWLNTKDGLIIWNEFNRRALHMSVKRKRFSASAIIEVIRWDTALKGGDEDFKINNNWTSGLARLWMHFNGDKHPTFFQLKGSAS